MFADIVGFLGLATTYRGIDTEKFTLVKRLRRVSQIASLGPGWPCCTNRVMVKALLSLGDSSHGCRDIYAKCGAALQHGDTDRKLGDLSVEVPCHEARSPQLYTVLLRLDVASAVVSAPPSPEGLAEVHRRHYTRPEAENGCLKATSAPR